MGSISIWHWIIVIIYLFVFMFPTAKILQKAGYSAWWCVVAVVPLLNLVMLWVFTFASSPNLPEKQG